MKSCRCIVKGRVQGVWYRKFTQSVAQKLGIAGEVRNLPDGSVEVKATLDDELLEPFLEALRKGPPLARVDGIEVEEVDERFEGGFRITG